MRALVIALCWLSVTAVLLTALLPWSNGEATTVGVLLLPVVAMLAWAALRPEAIGLVLPFACGIVVDAVTQGPIGVWSSGCVVAVGAGKVVLTATPDPGAFGARWLRIALSTFAASAAVWLTASLYHFEVQAGRPYALGALMAALSAPVVMLAVQPLARLGAGRRRLQLERQR